MLPPGGNGTVWCWFVSIRPVEVTGPVTGAAAELTVGV